MVYGAGKLVLRLAAVVGYHAVINLPRGRFLRSHRRYLTLIVSDRPVDSERYRVDTRRTFLLNIAAFGAGREGNG